MKDIETLVEYLQLNLEEFQIIGGFPDPKKQMNLPAISIVEAGSPVFTNLMPVLYNRDNNESVYLVGQYDKRLQLDIWTDYRDIRTDLYEKLHNVFMGQFVNSEQSAGLSLVLKDYYNAVARYDIVGYTILDAEPNSQVSEWRVKVDVLVNYPRLLSKTESSITQATIKHAIGEESNTENLDINETFVVY